jgi:hypothetical protein
MDGAVKWNKWICTLTVALVSVVSAAEEAQEPVVAVEPADVAIRFLGLIRERKVNLEPDGDTALVANTVAEKRKEIARRLDGMAKDVDGGSLAAGEVKVDGEIAGVLVRKGGGFDPARLKVFAVALVKRGGKWLPTPVLSSFENTGMGYTAEWRRRVQAMEEWMLRGQIEDLEVLRNEATTRMRSEIEARLTADELHEGTAEEIGKRFVEACGKRDLPAMLGMLGGLREVLPQDWNLRLKAADAAVGDGDRVKRPWRLLVAPEVLRVLVHEESDAKSGLISIACLDPAGVRAGSTLPALEVVHLELSRDRNALWQIDPPSSFLHGVTEEDDEDEVDDEDELLDRFPELLREDLPAKPKESLADAVNALEAGFREGSVAPLVSLLDLTGSRRTARLGCTRIAQAWRALNQSGEVRVAVPMGFHESGDAGVASYQFFVTREPDRVDLQHFYFRKTEAGWLLMPGVRPGVKVQGDLSVVRDWATENGRKWNEGWREKVLDKAVKIEAVAAGKAPTEEEARSLITGWIEAVRAGDFAGMIQRLAWQGGQASATRVLRNLNYELASVRRVTGMPVVGSVLRGDAWAAVAVKFGNADEELHPLYPVVQTPKGPRLLVEIDLIASNARTRQFLNEDSLKRLAPIAADDIRKELVDLFERHRKEILGAKP